MRKYLQSGPIVVILLFTLMIDHQSSLSNIVDFGITWCHHLDSSFREPGFRLVGDYTWHRLDGQPSFVDVYEAIEPDSDGNHDILIELDDSEDGRIDRIRLTGRHQLLKTSLIDSGDYDHLELISQIGSGENGLRCEYLRLDNGQFITNVEQVEFSERDRSAISARQSVASF